jgi:hypothetical protein
MGNGAELLPETLPPEGDSSGSRFPIRRRPAGVNLRSDNLEAPLARREERRITNAVPVGGSTQVIPGDRNMS